MFITPYYHKTMLTFRLKDVFFSLHWYSVTFWNINNSNFLPYINITSIIKHIHNWNYILNSDGMGRERESSCQYNWIVYFSRDRLYNLNGIILSLIYYLFNLLQVQYSWRLFSSPLLTIHLTAYPILLSFKYSLDFVKKKTGVLKIIHR